MWLIYFKTEIDTLLASLQNQLIMDYTGNNVVSLSVQFIWIKKTMQMFVEHESSLQTSGEVPRYTTIETP